MLAPCSVRYTATIKSIDPDGVGNGEPIEYNIEYKDESTHMVNRPTSLDTLSSMPVYYIEYEDEGGFTVNPSPLALSAPAPTLAPGPQPRPQPNPTPPPCPTSSSSSYR